LKILHVIPSVSKVHGGPSHALAMIERSLSAVGISVTTLTTDDDGPGRRLRLDARSRCIEGAARVYATKRIDFYKFAPGLVSWLLRHVQNFDVVHIHALFSFSSVAAASIAWKKGVPYVIRPLGTLSTYGMAQRRPWLKAASFKLIEARMLRHAAAIHFTSQSEWEEAKACGVYLRGVVIPLGVEGGGACGPIKLPFNVNGGQQIVLFLSRLDPKKNVEGLLRAFRIVRRLHENAVLVIAGDGPSEYVASLRALADEEGIADVTIWGGYVEGEYKRGLLSSAAIFVLPSFSENFGIAAVEAMLAGRPCIVSAGVAVADAIAEAGAGLVSGTDPSSIAGALDTLLGQTELRQKMGARGRELADREYSPLVMAQRLVELYSIVSQVDDRSFSDVS
jgi:glycosyltransferase involved in cell wall biosynthesis